MASIVQSSLIGGLLEELLGVVSCGLGLGEYGSEGVDTNPIESTFATVRLRAKVTRGAGSRTAALAMVFKLVESAQQRWRAVNAPHLVALVRAGARFERGHLVERPEVRAA
ncbi:hypothetical protein TNCT6_57570 [Streptomyces sp. 6-11-2]|nr:hypothetical protein TNCT6_57570 [Streptomyces sp. 6-11-2]